MATVGYQLVPRSTITGSQADTVRLAERQMTPPAVGVITTPAPLPPQPVGAVPVAAADTSGDAARRAEIDAIRKEIALRRARLDSIAGRVQGMGRRRALAIPLAGRSDIGTGAGHGSCAFAVHTTTIKLELPSEDARKC